MSFMGHIATASLFAHMPIIRDIVYGAVARGASLEALCAAISIPPEELTQADQRVDFDQSMMVWEAAVQATRDPLLGLHLGETASPSILGLVGHLMQSSANLEEAFLQVVENNAVFTNLFFYRLVKGKNQQVSIVFEAHPLWQRLSPLGARHATEQAMAGTVHVFRLLSGKRVVPVQAGFTTARGGALAEYERALGCPLRFRSETNHLVFTAAQLQTAVLTYDRSVFCILSEALATRKKAKGMAASKRITARLNELVATSFNGFVPAQEVLASHLHLTRRSLQRRLKEEGTTFRKWSAGWQKQLAMKLLTSGDAKVSEVARLLGYAEASSFRRAYKKWTNQVPAQTRKKA